MGVEVSVYPVQRMAKAPKIPKAVRRFLCRVSPRKASRKPSRRSAGKPGTGSPADAGPAKNKALGQHFLRAEGDADRVAAGLADWPLDAPVLEVGPGGGALTRALLDRLRQDRLLRPGSATGAEASAGAEDTTVQPPLWCCEKDRRFAEALSARFPALEGRILRSDFLRLDPALLPEGPLALVGNFPYNISSQIVFRVLDWRDRVPLMVGMFQKEVAERIAAGPGSKARGVLSVLTEAYYTRELLFELPPEAFDPPPKVHSSVLRLRRKTSPEGLLTDYGVLARVVKAAFAMRRKKLRNGLKNWRLRSDAPADAPAQLELLLEQRAEQLPLEAFLFLACALQAPA